MPVSPGYRAFVLEQLGACATITDRSMFGGVGLYADGLFFAVVGDDTLYFKVDDVTRPKYEAAGMPPFRPYGPDGAAMKGYFQVPAEVLEDGDALCVWVRDAMDTAERAKKGKRKKR